MKPLDVDVDAILEQTGRVGKYQIITFMIFGCIPIMLSSIHANNYIFAAQDVSYRCRVPGCDGNSNIFDQPWASDARPDSARCERYGFNSSWSGDISVETCSALTFNRSELLGCDDEYVYEIENTLVEELDIPCETWKRTLLGTLHSLGTLLALPFIGTLSDRFGRLHVMIWSNIIEGILGIIKGLSVSYVMFATMELMEPTLGSGGYSSIYVLILEFVPPEMRVMAGCVINIFFGCGQMLVGFFAWVFRYWRTYIYVIYAPAFVLIFYYWVFDESPRWLISKHRYQEAKDILLKVANKNGKTISPKSLENLDINIQNVEQISNPNKVESSDEKKLSPWAEVLKSRILVVRVIQVSFWWITCTFCFYGLSINSAVLPGNGYVNFIIAASTEIPAHIGAYFGMTYIGRKKTLFLCFLVGGLCLISFPFIPQDLLWLSLVAYFTGKLFVTAAFNGIYLYTSELFPTTLRHSLLATCSMIGRIGSITAPQTPLLAEILPELPAYLFASFCLISALLMLNSPETLGARLPDTVEEAENLSSSRRNLINNENYQP